MLEYQADGGVCQADGGGCHAEGDARWGEGHETVGGCQTECMMSDGGMDVRQGERHQTEGRVSDKREDVRWSGGKGHQMEGECIRQRGRINGRCQMEGRVSKGID